MKIYKICPIFPFIFTMLLISTASVPIAIASGVPTNSNGSISTQEQVFNGHTFSENYWDINVFNNSYWDGDKVNNMTSWLNNTWNIKWIKEGNFEMGMLAFMNKTMYEDGRHVTYTTPAQMWWQHVYKDGAEVLIGSMHCAWFGFNDDNKNRYYDEGEDMSPFFYMGANTKNMTEDVGIISNPKAEASPLQRSESGSEITYTWSYNYSDIIFYVPQINHSEGEINYGFEWGFNYSDPGTYINGSHHIGNMSYIAYEYTLEIDTEEGISTLHQDYHSSEISHMKWRYNETSDWEDCNPPYDAWVPVNWSLCLGTWSFIVAGKDEYALEDPGVGEINANVTKTGLTKVETTLGGVHAFDFNFNQKPNYDIQNHSKNDPTSGTHPVVYECLSTNESDEFINFVSGMLHLVGDFGRVVLAYAINQTNHFTNGIEFDFAYEEIHPNDTAAFFINCYPEYGAYGGGKLDHDPIYMAYFDPEKDKKKDDDKETPAAIPGYQVEILSISMFIGTILLVLYKTKKSK